MRNFKYIFSATIISWLSLISYAEATALTTDELLMQNCMIWTDSVPKENQYVAFCKSFELDNVSEKDTLDIFADSRYLLWLNGEYVGRGPVRFDPKNPEYDAISISKYLKTGKNTIVVLVHNYGNAINGRIMANHPGLGAILHRNDTVLLHTDETWCCNVNTRYLSAPESWNSVPTIIDGRIDDEEWINGDKAKGLWHSVFTVSGKEWGKIRQTDIPRCIEKEISEYKEAQTSSNLTFPLIIHPNQPLTIDLGEMSMAYIDMDLNAPANINLKMEYAIRFLNGKPKETFGAGDYYITTEGHQHFTTTDQWCYRYLTLKIDSGEVIINKLNIVDRKYPFKRVGEFECNNEFYNKLWDMGVRTIEATSDDAYGSDARERNEWIQDAHKASFMTSSISLSSHADSTIDCSLLKSMLRHAALSQHDDGMLSATFPTDRGAEDCHYVIEDYALQWIDALWHYYWFTNDLLFVEENCEVMIKLIDWFNSRLSKNGLVYAREYASFDNPLAYVVCEGATLNAFYYGALQSAISLMRAMGKNNLANDYHNLAHNLKECYIKYLWDEKENAVSAGIKDGKILPPSVHAQIMALYYGILDSNQIPGVRKWLLHNFHNPSYLHCCVNPDCDDMLNNCTGVNMPITYHWLLKALYDIDIAEMDSFILDEIYNRWENMVNLQSDAGTLSESFVNADGTGSHESCHNYGAIPVYYLSAYVLGVRETENGILIQPRLGNLTYAKGKVITSKGPIEVNWQKDGNITFNFSIKTNNDVFYSLNLPKPNENQILIINNSTISDLNNDNSRWLNIDNLQGTLEGTIKIIK